MSSGEDLNYFQFGDIENNNLIDTFMYEALCIDGTDSLKLDI